MLKSLRVLLALGLMLTLAASIASAKGDKMKGMSNDMTATLEAKEKQINDAWKNKDMTTFMMNIDAAAFQGDATGFSPVSAAADMMKDSEVKSYTIENAKATMIDKDAYILTYVWKGEASYKGQPMNGPTYCSTIYAKRGKDWKAVYHQESMGMAATPAAESH